MSLAWGSLTDQRLKENIALLYLIGKNQGRPLENPVPALLSERTTAPNDKWTLVREGELVDTVAFLSATTDNREMVMAACIERHTASNSMTIRLATNSGDDRLQKEAVIRMTTVLERIAREGKLIHLLCTSW